MKKEIFIILLFLAFVKGKKDIVSIIHAVVNMEFHQKTITVLLGSPRLHTAMQLPPRINPTSRLLQNLCQNYSIQIVQQAANHSNSWPAPKARQIFIVVFDATMVEKDISTWKNIPGWSGRAQICLLLLDERVELVDKIVTLLWTRARIANAVIIDSQFKIYNWTPYSKFYCSLDILSQSITSYLHQKKQLTNKSKKNWNLNQCFITAASADIPPYVHWLAYNKFWMGFELRIFQMMARLLNFQYRFIIPADGENFWKTTEDGEPFGLYKKLSEYEADFLFHGIPGSWDRYLIADCLEPYYVDSYGWVAPLYEKVQLWQIVFRVFDTLTWIGTVAVMILASLLLIFVAKLGWGSGASLTFSLILNVAVPDFHLFAGNLPTIPRALFISTFLFFILNITAVYQSGLFHAMSEGLETVAIETAFGMAQRGYILNIHPEAREMVKVGYPELYDYITNENLVNWTTDAAWTIKDAAYQRSVSLNTEIGVTYTANLIYKTKDNKLYIRMLKERFGPYGTGFFLSKDHPLTPAAQLITRRLVEHGWVRHFIDESMYLALRLKEYAESEQLEKEVGYFHERVEQLGMEQLLGAFIILVFMLIAAVCVFVIEIVVGKCRGTARVGPHPSIRSIRHVNHNRLSR